MENTPRITRICAPASARTQHTRPTPVTGAHTHLPTKQLLVGKQRGRLSLGLRCRLQLLCTQHLLPRSPRSLLPMCAFRRAHVQIHARKRARAHTHTHARAPAHTRTHARTHTHTHTHTHLLTPQLHPHAETSTVELHAAARVAHSHQRGVGRVHEWEVVDAEVCQLPAYASWANICRGVGTQFERLQSRQAGHLACAAIIEPW